MSQTSTEDPIAARLDRIEQRLDRLTSMLDDALPTVALAADAADEWVGGLQRRGIDIDARVGAASRLLERATEPDTLDRLAALLDRLAGLEPALDLVDHVDRLIAMAGDTFDEWAGDLAARGVDLDARVAWALRMLERMTPEAMSTLEHAVDALPALDAAVQAGRIASTALQRAGDAPRIGLLGMLGALGDPGVQRAMGIAVQVARSVGTRLPDELTASSTLPART